MDWLSHWSLWHWILLGLVLLSTEIFISGVFLLWWGLAALAIAVVDFFIPNLSLTTLFISYALLAILFTLLWWKYQHKKDSQDQAKTSLNQRDHAMLGCKGKVQEMSESGIGRGYFGDTTWRIQGEDLQPNDLIEVIAVRGITLQVRKVRKGE